MYTGVLDNIWIIIFYLSIGYSIRPPSKLYEENKATIKRFLEDIITHQARPLCVLITALHEIHLLNKFDMAEKRSNMQLVDINYKHHGGKSLRDIIDRSIVFRFYPPPGSDHYKLLPLDRFHGSTHRQA